MKRSLSWEERELAQALREERFYHRLLRKGQKTYQTENIANLLECVQMRIRDAECAISRRSPSTGD